MLDVAGRSVVACPHNAIFDFEAASAGAEWTDEIARKAKQGNPRSIGRVVVGHADWSAKHLGPALCPLIPPRQRYP